MKRLFGSIILVTLLAPEAGRATDAMWVNNGTIVVAPNIDATNVINNGTMNIATFPLPFDTSNTRNFTNTGTMIGSLGWRFDNAPRNSSGQLIGQRKLAENFHNRLTGMVSATDGLLASGFRGSYLLVNATNLVNQGTLSVGGGGLLQLVGTNVNISRSALAVNSIVGVGSSNGETNFSPDTAITDNHWGQTNDTFSVNQLTANVTTNLVVKSPTHSVSNTITLFTTQVSNNIPLVSITNVVAVYTNLVGGTNYVLTNANKGVDILFYPTSIVRQVVFVGLSSTNFGTKIRFSPSPVFTNLMRGVGVQIFSVLTNVVTQSNETNSIYFADTLASLTNRDTLLNTKDGTRRPANYILSRLPVPQFSGGVASPTAFANSLLYAPDFDAASSYGDYSGYSATVDNLSSRPPNIPAGDYTNNPGRIEIWADQLDMNKARLRAEGLLSINANHLINSSNAVVDCENLSYNLASTNGTLRVQGLMKETVNRVRGDVVAWSGLWTNSYSQLLTNYDTSTNPVVAAFITNTVLVNYHVLMLNAKVLLDQLPVSVYELHAKATNVIVSDSGIVRRTLLVEGDSLTLNGNLTLTDSLQDWSQALAPTLKRFTNTATMTIPSEAHFGDEGLTPYQSFVNSGNIQSFGQNIRSDYALLSGLHDVFASFSLQSLDGHIDAGLIDAGGSVTLSGNAIKLSNQAFVSSGGSLLLNVTNSLSDGGVSSLNGISVRDGFFMTTKPAAGDLLGTGIFTHAPNNAQVNHVWAGRNDGVSNAGFSNNVALAYLDLVPDGFDPLFVFSGAGANNGLYVDWLDLSDLTDYASQLQIDPNLVIYYALATVNFTPPGGLSASEYLDGQFAGRLRWVPGFAGPNSSTNVTINGSQVISVNLAIRTSTILDSDADGTVNNSDTSPFDGVNISSIQRNTSPAGYKLTWSAAPNTLYRVEAKTNLASPVWSSQLTTTCTNTNVAPWTVVDTNATPAGVTRYYRVTYSPN